MIPKKINGRRYKENIAAKVTFSDTQFTILYSITGGSDDNTSTWCCCCCSRWLFVRNWWLWWSVSKRIVENLYSKILFISFKPNRILYFSNNSQFVYFSIVKKIPMNIWVLLNIFLFAQYVRRCWICIKKLSCHLYHIFGENNPIGGIWVSKESVTFFVIRPAWDINFLQSRWQLNFQYIWISNFIS